MDPVVIVLLIGGAAVLYWAYDSAMKRAEKQQQVVEDTKEEVEETIAEVEEVLEQVVTKVKKAELEKLNKQEIEDLGDKHGIQLSTRDKKAVMIEKFLAAQNK